MMLRIGFVIALSSVSLAGPAPQSSRPACASLPATSRNVTTGARGGGSVDYTCVFSASPVSLTCTGGGGMGVKVTTVTTYKSKDDLVDTVTVIPPLVRSESLKLTGPGSGTSTTYTYDSQKRLMREVATTGTIVVVTTEYSDWDTFGRPRKARISTTPGNRAPSDQTFKYDDTARTKTITTTQSGAVSTDVVTFDENGNQIKAIGSGANGTYTSTTTISSTTKVCR